MGVCALRGVQRKGGVEGWVWVSRQRPPGDATLRFHGGDFVEHDLRCVMRGACCVSGRYHPSRSVLALPFPSQGLRWLQVGEASARDLPQFAELMAR